MKNLLVLTLLCVSFSSFANVLRCDGEKTLASLKLTLPGTPSSIGQGEYSFSNKIIPASLNAFGIQSDNDSQTQELIYRFTTLKKHKLARKNSKLALVVKQNLVVSDPFSFRLNESHEALLFDESNGESVILDKLNCRELSN